MSNRHITLTVRPVENRPFRWLPRQGRAVTIAEWIIQGVVKLFAWLPVYTAVVVTATLLLVIFGVPFAGGD